MHSVRRVVFEADVAGFIECLERAADHDSRHLLKTLLIEKEDRFGYCTALFDITDYNIVQAGCRIREQERRLEELKAKGQDTEQAELLLANMHDVWGFLKAARERWLDQLTSSVPLGG